MDLVEKIPADAQPINESGAAFSAEFAPRSKHIEFTTPDGTKITLEKQQSSQRLIDAILADSPIVNPVLLERRIRFVKSLLTVTKINDTAVIKPVNHISLTALEQKLGDENVDYVYLQCMTHFPLADSDEIKDLKKF